MIELFKLLHSERKGDFMANKTNDMAHTKWMCKYHMSLLQSIDEKQFIINTKKVYGIY